MNNNRGNNRRRGRGNNNRPQGGGQQLNRIDSRARGNAPQMLEKYRKLAQDAHLNGDRVQAEYYLQFADHYFRVIADSRTRVDEQRQRPNGERWNEGEGEDDGTDFSMESDFPAFDRPQSRREEGRREEGRREESREPRENQQREGREPRENREPRDNREPREYREPREQREPRENRENREPRENQRPRFEAAPVAEAMVRADEGEPIGDTGENPFVRDSRAQRGLRPRTERRPRREAEEAPVAALDPMSLPPAIGVRAAPEPEVVEETPATAAPAEAADAGAPAPKRRGRPRKNPLPEAAEG
ncbi:hypothetical protein NSE01_12850 [Novosphingobium sediminis]|uniref:DUF4167 domain-containing protein n=1 Tax=Novosphingobium sediminis TaxID=707214 RepID=A0A512AIJ8_9SPHN|nr:DUF4167 domain-containing protein [Novosphingobium sediminis]GEN99452.1 hypothetical protein NSE01_12850 [Novosphingobium sediminis]